MPVQLPPNTTTYRPDIDGLRAVAVLAVLAYHLNPLYLPGGFLGVDVFFVISGYVVTSSLLSQSAMGFWRLIGDFYARRFARILPALCIVLVVSALLATLLIPHSWLSGLSERTGLSAFLGLSNWVMQSNEDTYFAPRAEFNPYTQTWSLGVEEQFYLLAPLLIYFWLRWTSTSHWLRHYALGIVLLLCCASVGYFVMQVLEHPNVAFYFIGCRFWELGLGVVLMLSQSRFGLAWVNNNRAFSTVLPVLGLASLAIALILAAPNQYAWIWYLLAVLGTGVILQSGAAGSAQWLGRGLGQAAAVWVGKRSYSIYLWHWPVFVLLRWTAGLESVGSMMAGVGLTLVLAVASYSWLEKPLRHQPTIEAWSSWTRILLFAIFPLLGYQLTELMFANREHMSLSVVSKNTIDWYASNQMPYVAPADRNCQVTLSTISIAAGVEYVFTPHDCKTPATARTLSALGDSHAGAYHPMFEQLSADTGIKVHVYEFAGCAFIDFRAPMDRHRPPGCLEFSRAILKDVIDASQPGDLVFLPSLRLNRYGDQWASFHIADMKAQMYNEATIKDREDATADAENWLNPLAQRGLHLIFEAPKPIFQAPTFRCADWFNRSNPICVGDNQQPRKLLEDLRHPIVVQMDRLRTALPSAVSTWDPFPVLCPNDMCSALRDGRPMFFDGDHPSAYGNWLLYPSFKGMIASISTN